MQPYRQAQTILRGLLRQANDQFRRLSALPFDGLNILETSKRTRQAYRRMDQANRAAYLEISRNAYENGWMMAVQAGYSSKKKKYPDAKWVAAYLLALNGVTKYFYQSETERKQLRLAEEMAADREIGNRSGLRQDVRAAANAWWKQTEQYAIGAEDAAMLDAFADAGVEKVRWVSYLDKKACKICRERNGRVYRIEEVPEKPHYHCRCYLAPVPPEKA